MPHYFSEKQDSEFRKKTIRRNLLGAGLEFSVGSGMFSKDRVDTGTVILIEHSIIPAESGEEPIRILDLGCGYGPVGIAVAKKYPDAKITMVETNERALSLARKNLELNNIKNARCFKSDLFSAISKDDNAKNNFDAILVNPPMSAGRKLCYKIIEESKDHLKDGGTLQLIAMHNKGGKMLGQKIEEVFGNMTTLVKSGGYRIYMGIRK